MRSGWLPCTIQDVVLGVYDGPHATPKFSSQGPIFLGIRNLTVDGKLDLSEINYLSEVDFSLWTRRVLPKENDLVFIYEATLHRYAIIPKDFRCCLGRRMALLRPNENKVLPKFLLYYFLSPEWRQVIERKIVIGATVNRIPISEFDSFPLVLPNRETQQNIASFLSALDDKIELNNRINSELEAMAKLIYEYWFVQFDFPDANGKPYKASGGKMVWNEQLKREIPEGWEVKKLNDIYSIQTGSLTPSNFPSKEFRLFSIPVFDSSGTFSTNLGAEIESNKYLVGPKDILISKLNPWFNRVIFDTYEADQICSTEFVVLESNSLEAKVFLYFIATNQDFINFLTRNAFGTSNSHKRVNPQTLVSWTFPFNSDLMKRFGELTFPILEKIRKGKRENQELGSLRDWLLPMLMNGQVRVGGDYQEREEEIHMAAEPNSKAYGN